MHAVKIKEEKCDEIFEHCTLLSTLKLEVVEMDISQIISIANDKLMQLFSTFYYQFTRKIIQYGRPDQEIGVMLEVVKDHRLWFLSFRGIMAEINVAVPNVTPRISRVETNFSLIYEGLKCHLTYIAGLVKRLNPSLGRTLNLANAAFLSQIRVYIASIDASRNLPQDYPFRNDRIPIEDDIVTNTILYVDQNMYNELFN